MEDVSGGWRRRFRKFVRKVVKVVKIVVIVYIVVKVVVVVVGKRFIDDEVRNILLFNFMYLLFDL